MKVRNLGLENRFIFKGRAQKTELINFYQNATMHVIPSHYEGLPTVLLEAMSCGLPVIATAVSGNLDVIENGKNGSLVPPGSPGGIANAISILLEDSSMRSYLGRAAGKTVGEKFTWDIVSNRMIQCYNTLNKIR